MLLTTLPLVFGERFGIEATGSAALTRLETRYRVEPIAVAEAAQIKGRRLMLAAHPRAQPAEALIELDQWLRGGGRLLLLADPALDWHSERAFGDLLRPPPAFADTGLLAHWGLELESPERRGAAERRSRGYRLRLGSPGRITGNCPLDGQGVIARCAVGKGKVTVVADADLLDERGVEGAAASENLDWLSAELASLESR